MIADALRVLALSTLASGAAIVLALLLRKPLRQRSGAQAAYALWAMVPIAALVALLPAPAAPVAPSMNFDAAVPVAVQAIPLTAAAAPSIDPMPLLGAGWLLGLLICLALFLRQQRRFVRALGDLSPDVDRTFRAQTTAGCPALVGAWRPRIVLPADFERRYDSAERALILAHERAHCTRGDAQANALAAALRCLYWFNPLMHIAASRFRFDQELACDATVITQFPEARRPYADAMLKTQLADLGLPVGCHWQSSHPLKERIAMLKKPLPGRARAALGLGLVAALIMGGSYVAWAAQPAAPAKSAQTAPSTPVLPAATTSTASNVTSVGYQRMTRIEYPQSAIVANAEGVVYVDVHIGADGKVADAKVNSVMPVARTDLADAAVAAVKTWNFNPRIVDGNAVASDTTVSVAFSLDPDKPLTVAPGVLDAIRVSPPAADSASSEDKSVTENAEFRLMRPPKYPAAAIEAHEQGKIVLKVHVDAQGLPLEANVFKAEPKNIAATFGNPSIAAVMQWQFNPARKHGKAVDGWVLVPFTFSLTKL